MIVFSLKVALDEDVEPWSVRGHLVYSATVEECLEDCVQSELTHCLVGLELPQGQVVAVETKAIRGVRRGDRIGLMMGPLLDRVGGTTP